MQLRKLAPSGLLHNLSPRGLALAVFCMVFVSITGPAGYLYLLVIESPVDTDRIQQAGLVTFVIAGLLSFILARFAQQLRAKSLNLVSQMKTAEDQLREQMEKAERANQGKSELLAVAAHDLKNPLSAIVGMSDIILDMKRSAPDQAAVKDDIDIIEGINTSATHMLEIVRGILANEGLQLGWIDTKRESVNLPEICREALKFNAASAQRKRIKLQADIAEELTLVGDRILLHEALDNYVSNAIKFSPNDKTVTLSLKTAQHGKVAEIAVTDEGPGLSAADQAKLFEKFKKLSARPTGGEFSTGLGLSIVKTIVERHQGTVGCESQPGQGCRFWMRLPLISPLPQK
jgi:signal transduction histidine kinase